MSENKKCLVSYWFERKSNNASSFYYEGFGDMLYDNITDVNMEVIEDIKRLIGERHDGAYEKVCNAVIINIIKVGN